MQTQLAHSGHKYGLWNRYFLGLMILSLFSGACNQFFNSTLSLHFDALGISSAYTGVAMMSFTAAAAVFRIFAGKFSDSVGRRVVILVGFAIMAAGSLLFAFFDNLAVMIMLRVVQGIGFALSGTALMVAVSDVVPKARMGEGIGYYGLSASLTQAVGPSVALSLFYGPLGYGGVSVTAAVSLLVAILIMFFCNYEKDPSFEIVRTPLKQDVGEIKNQGQKGFWLAFERKAAPMGVISFFSALASGVVIGFLTLYADKTGVANPGLYFTLSAIMIVCARLLTGKITDKYGPVYSVVPGFLFGIAAYVCLLLSKNITVLFYIAGAFNGLCGGMTAPALNAEAIRRSPEHRRGAASATYQTPMEIAFAISALLGGILINSLGFSFVFSMSLICFGISLVLSIIFLRKPREG